MKNKTYFLNTILALVLGITLLAAILVRTFAPVVIIPALNIPGMVLISLAALVLDHYLAPGAKRCYICIPVFSFVTFGLLTYCAGFAGVYDAVKLGAFGCVVFTVTTFLYSSVQDRLSSGPAAKAAPVVSAIGLYLASQCLTGIFL